MLKLIVGPFIGAESNSGFTFCFTTSKEINGATVTVDGELSVAGLIAEIPDGKFWRACSEVIAKDGTEGRYVDYTIALDGQEAADANGRHQWRFFVPGTDEEPLIAYTSCNGVSKSDLIAKIESPFALWEKMHGIQGEQPISLLLMGGDQIYADSIWDKVKDLERWSTLKHEQQVARPLTKRLEEQLDRFYSRLYVERWNEPALSLMLASVPSAMMWDDHDIFDGWGSFPDALQRSAVFQGIFSYAKKYYDLYQLRSRKNRSLISSGEQNCSFYFRFRKYHILGLDNRSERTIQQVMSDSHWREVIATLREIDSESLLVMSAVPVVYRDFSFTETAFSATPWSEELEDDLKDHWRAKEHQGERNRLIMNLLSNARLRAEQDRRNRTLLLSGDVHVGCLGVITDKTKQDTVKIHQVVSSGIVHPAPSLIAWLGIQAVTNDDTEILNEDGTIEATMLKPVGSSKYIRARNFITMSRGTDEKLWINWITESDENPVYPIN